MISRGWDAGTGEVLSSQRRSVLLRDSDRLGVPEFQKQAALIISGSRQEDHSDSKPSRNVS